MCFYTFDMEFYNYYIIYIKILDGDKHLDSSSVCSLAPGAKRKQTEDESSPVFPMQCSTHYGWKKGYIINGVTHE